MSYIQLRYLSLEDGATEAGVNLLNKAQSFRHDGKPEQWAKDVERKALRKFEHAFSLRHMFDREYWPRPECLPPSAYSNR